MWVKTHCAMFFGEGYPSRKQWHSLGTEANTMLLSSQLAHSPRGLAALSRQPR